MKHGRILFVTWDGPGLSYLETLFLPIFFGLKAHGWHVDVLQFRWGSAQERQRVEAACRAAGVGYRSVTIRRTPRTIAPLASAVMGGLHVRRAIRYFGSDIVLPRSTMPALAVLSGRVAGRRPIVFDADGLEIDERAEFDGLSPVGAGYRLLRDVEGWMARCATAVLTRTGAARDVLLARAGPALDPNRAFIVANGRDPDAFQTFDSVERAVVRRSLGIGEHAPLIVYIGSTGHKYDTPAIGALALALAARRPDTRLLLLTGAPEKAAAELGIAVQPALAAMTQIRRVAPDEVPRFLAAADIGTAFSRVSFSTRGVSPIKVGEYLLCGVPIVGTAAIGNNDAAVAAGVYLDEAHDMARAADWVETHVLADRENMRQRARAVGSAHYSLDRSVADYGAALSTIVS